MSPPKDLVKETANDIASDVRHDRGLDAVRDELNELRDAHMGNDNKLSKDELTAFRADLRQVSEILHDKKILPRVDFVATNAGDAALLGISGDGKADGHGTRMTNIRGMQYEYDKSGHVTQYSTDKEGKNVWKYSKEDGLYHEYVDVTESGKTSNDVISVDEKGRVKVTHGDGSSTLTLRWGGVIERNAEGQITETRRSKQVRTFQYEDGKLVGITDFASKEDQAANNPSGGYTYDPATKKFYANTDAEKADPLDIKVLNQKGDRGTVVLTHQDGSYDRQRMGGTTTHWNANGELTAIDYKNGNTATDFSYNDKHELVGFKMTGKDGVTHTYTTKNGNVIIDEGTPDERKIKGSLTNDEDGFITVTEVGDESDRQYKKTTFRLNGTVVTAGIDGVTSVINPRGEEQTFGYNKDGELNEVKAYGYDMRLVNGQWVDADGKQVKGVPKVLANGTLKIVREDGTFDAVSSGSIRYSGEKEPTPPEAPASRPGATGDIAEDILYWAERCVGKAMWRQKRHSEVNPASTANGYYGCSASVSAILGLADVDKGETDGPHNSNFLAENFGKTGLASRLARNLDKLDGWDRIHFKSYSQLKPGDIIDGIDSNGVNGHIGIVGPKVNGQWTVYENSSSRGRWEQHPLTANFAIGNDRFDGRMWIIRPPA